jgi:hypothetical protein
MCNYALARSSVTQGQALGRRLLRNKGKEVIEDCSWDLSVTVLEAMLSLCHKKKESLYMSEVANDSA